MIKKEKVEYFKEGYEPAISIGKCENGKYYSYNWKLKLWYENFDKWGKMWYGGIDADSITKEEAERIIKKSTGKEVDLDKVPTVD